SLLIGEDPSLASPYLQIDRDMDGRIDEGVSSEKLKTFLNAVCKKKEARYYIHKNKNGNFDALLIRVMTDTTMGYHGIEALNDLKEDFKENGNVEFAGTPIVWAKGMNDMRDSMTNSILLCLGFAFVVLTIVFTLSHRSPLLGFLTALPPFIVIGWLFMTLNLLDIPLNSMTAMVGAIVVGIGIDYPIHIANRWAVERKEGRTPEECYRISIGSTGKEVFYSSLTTLVVFATFLPLNMPVIKQFGEAIVFGLLYSLLAAVIILPLFLRLLWHRGD
ncbi:MAG: MMPL family transporter, partial [Euryarchaeota archaeon]|nr:MMPL family transporter [Euryarchaeota archaeon]